jgi:hypothetical protein
MMVDATAGGGIDGQKKEQSGSREIASRFAGKWAVQRQVRF